MLTTCTQVFAQTRTLGKDLLNYTDSTLSAYNITARKDVNKIIHSIQELRRPHL